MKKVILFLIIIITLFSCGKNEPVAKSNQFIQKSNLSDYSAELNKFEYEGHTYYQFGGGTASSIVHSPDCKCKKQ